MNKFSFGKIDKRKFFGTVIGGIFFIGCILFVTYAYYSWRSDQTGVVLGIQDLNMSMECVLGTDVNATNIGPVLDYKDGVKADFSITTSTTETVSLSLDIVSISENLLVDDFKYALVYDTEGGFDYDYDTPILEGDFSSFQVGTNVITDALTILSGSTYSYQFIVYIDGNMYNDPNMQNNNLEANISLGDCGEVSNSEPIEVAQYVGNLYNNGEPLTTVNIGGSTDNPSVSLNASKSIMLDNNDEYRYYGSNPSNYVKFNDELWRIISVSNVKSNATDTVGEQRIKIVRDESIGNYSWDSSSSNINSGNGVNDWTKADLMTELNTLYYNKKSGTCYNGYQNASTSCDFTNIGLNSNARKMVGNALWHLGGVDEANATQSYADDYYNAEKGSAVYGCSTDDGSCPRATTWTGKVGLMSASDYTYAVDFSSCSYFGFSYSNSECYNNNWLAVETYNSNGQWTLTPGIMEGTYVYYVMNGGELISNYIGYNACASKDIRPVVYLKSDVVITAGTGTSGNPYILNYINGDEVDPTCNLEVSSATYDSVKVNFTCNDDSGIDSYEMVMTGNNNDGCSYNSEGSFNETVSEQCTFSKFNLSNIELTAVDGNSNSKVFTLSDEQLDTAYNMIYEELNSEYEEENEDFDSDASALDAIYPVGSIYVSASSTNPGSIFGGTWEAYATGRTLIGVGSNGTNNYTASGATGGTESVTLTTANIPKHSHTITPTGTVSSSFSGTANMSTSSDGTAHAHSFSTVAATGGNWSIGEASYGYGDSGFLDRIIVTNSYTSTTSSAGAHTHTYTASGSVSSTFTGTSVNTNSVGSGTAFNVVNPYIVTYIWKRTA